MYRSIYRVATIAGLFAGAGVAVADPGGPAKALDPQQQVAALEKLVRELHERAESLERENKRLKLQLDIQVSGHVLAKVKSGMSHKGVEAILGRPDRVRDEEESTAEGTAATQVATYYLKIPNHPGEQLMTVHYRKTKVEWAFHEWRGPHFPKTKGDWAFHEWRGPHFPD